MLLLALGALALAAAPDGGVPPEAAQRLRALDVPAAVQLLESAPDSPERRELLGTLLSATEPARSNKLLEKVPRPAPLYPLKWAPPPPSGPAWVMADGAAMNKEPKAGAVHRRRLPVGTPVEVLRHGRDGWVQVRTVKERVWATVAAPEPGGGFRLKPPMTVPAVLNQEYHPGWVRLEALSGAQPSALAMDAKAREELGEKKLEKALGWALRALALAPSRQRQAFAVSVALEAQRWSHAASVAQRRLPLERPGDYSEALLEVAWGCIREHDIRVLEVRDGAALFTGMLAPAVCIDVFDTAPCGPCAQEKAAPVEAAAKAFAARRAKQRKAFPRGPFLKVRFDPEEVPEGQSPFVALVDPGPERKVVEVLAVPEVKAPPKHLLDVWFPVEAPEGRRFDLFYAASREEAERAAAGGITPVVAHARPAGSCACPPAR